MPNNSEPEQSLPAANLVDLLSKIVGEREIGQEIIFEKCKDIVKWEEILEHQKLLKESLHRDISVNTALFDLLMSKGEKSSEARLIEIPSTQKVSYTSIVDPLTGLYNERFFQLIVEAEIKKAKQYSFPLTLIILDMDNFGLYSALYGHETSDIALNETGIVLRKSCRKEDMFFRLKKNRFSVVLLNIAREGAHRLGERLRQSVESHDFKGADKLPSKKLTISGGIAIYPDDGKNSQTLIMAAEEALTTAKQSGKNRILEYSIKRRKTPRIEKEMEAKYQIEGRKDIKPQPVSIKNISESGVLLTASSDLPLGGLVILTIKLPTGTTIKAKGETVRLARKEGANQTTLAVKFIDLSPVDGLNLKNFIDKELTKGS